MDDTRETRLRGLRRGGGRPKGAKNKLPGQIKELVEQALAEAGGVAYLRRQARKHPAAFMALVGKLIPRDFNVSGEVRHTLESMILAGMQPKLTQSDKSEPGSVEILPH